MIFSYIFRGGKRTENDKTNIKILEFMRVLPFVCIIPYGHSYCVVLCENDVNIKVIQEVMGHANVATSLNVYAEVSAAKKHTELSRIEEKFVQLSQIS